MGKKLYNAGEKLYYAGKKLSRGQKVESRESNNVQKDIMRTQGVTKQIY